MPPAEGGGSLETGLRRIPIGVIGGLVYALALAVRLPICLTRPLDGDEAIQGIAAQHLLENGHWTWYFPGQKYGGTLEIIPQALFQAIDEGSIFLLRLPLVMIAAGIVLLLACLALELTRSRVAFVAVGALASVFPPLFVFLGSWQTAGYNTSIFLGVAAVYLLVRALRPSVSDGRRSLVVAAAGLCVGLALYEQPQAIFVISALGTMAAVATWPRPRRLLAPRYVAIFLVLAVIGVAPQAVAIAGGLGTNTANNPLPPGYHVTGSLLTTVWGLHLFGTGATPLLFPGGFESMTWNVLGVGYLDQLLVAEWIAILLSAAMWAVVVGSVAFGLRALRRKQSPRGASASEEGPRLLGPALAAGALAAAIVVSVAIVRLPPFAKYAYGLQGFAAFALAIVTVQLWSRSRLAAAVLAAGLLVLAGLSVSKLMDVYDGERESPLPDQLSWLLDEAREASSAGDSDVIYGDYWAVYPLEFMSGGDLEAIPSSFDRFPKRHAGDIPAGKVIVPIAQDLPFEEQVAASLGEHCTVKSKRESGGARLLVAAC